jgi:exosortase
MQRSWTSVDAHLLNSRQREILITLVLAGILGWLYWSIVGALIRQWWEDDNYSHGFLVPLFSGYLIWQRRADLRALTPNGSWIGLLVLMAGAAALLLGELGAENFIMRSSLIVVLAGLVLFHLGRDSFRELAFPLLFLMFAVPLPATLFYAVAFPLQNLAARNAALVLDLLGIPVLIEGNVIHLSQISLGVTEACSGTRSLISLLCAAVALAALTLPGMWGRSALVAAAVPITVAANAGRVVATGLIGEWIGVNYARGFFHAVSGWLFFALAFGGLLAVQSILRFVQAPRRVVR